MMILGDSRFVVGSEQCGAVGYYKRLPLVVVELGEFSLGLSTIPFQR